MNDYDHSGYHTLKLQRRIIDFYVKIIENWYHQAQINSMIKMKLLEMDKVKAVWNKYAANKITVTITKSWRVMIETETEIYLINFENKLTDDFEI